MSRYLHKYPTLVPLARPLNSLHFSRSLMVSSELLHHILLLAVAFAVSAPLYALRLRRGKKLPPGPKGLPFIGNLSDFTKPYAWEHFKDLGKEYGVLSYLSPRH